MPGPFHPIALVLFNDERDLLFYVSPQYQELAAKEDATYLDALFHDFCKRASLEPASLFKQISSLSVGPLITEATGEDLVDCPELIKATMNFVLFDGQTDMGAPQPEQS